MTNCCISPSERHEQIACEAERNYDSMREEQIMSNPTPDDHLDESEWRDFLETKARYWSNLMLSKATRDLLQERAGRLPKDFPENEQSFLDRVSETGEALNEFHKEFTKRSPF